MKRLPAILAALILLLGGKWLFTQTFGDDTIEYRGERIKLTKKYSDYDDYKNDPHNLSAAERQRVDRMMREVKLGPVFNDYADFGRQLSELKFPGYGQGGGPTVHAVGRKLFATSVEIPSETPDEKNRYFVVEELPDKTLRLVDDFVYSDEAFLTEVQLIDDKLLYYGQAKRVVRETKLNP